MARSRLSTGNHLATFLVYFAMIAASIVIFLYIRSLGQDLSPGIVRPPPIAGPETSQIDTLLHFLLALSVVVIMARILGAIFRFLHQPPVIGEVVGGIMLGPSLLGKYAPELSAYLLPQTAIPFLGIIAQLGVILYMFLVGLELDLKVIRRSGHTTLAISHASIVTPFLLGAGLALHLYPILGSSDVRFAVFAMFLGVSMSVTAFPVLARILTDKGWSKTRMGAIALTCAAVDDVTAWCLLAFVVSVSQAKIGGAFLTVALTIGYIALMFFVVRPIVARSVPALETFDRITKGGMAIILVALLVSSLVTEFIGIHAIFGAFLLGAITPHNSRVATEVTERLEDLVSVLFLPAFFAFTGMRTQMGLVNGLENWILCGWIVLVAIVGKFGGSFIAAKLSGLNARDSASLGVLMNTRGLVELIVLNIGLDLGVISSTLFTMLVIMALVTTFITTPLLHLITRNHPWVSDPSEPEKPMPTSPADFS